MPVRPEPKQNKVTYVEPKKSWNSTDFKYNRAEWIKLRNKVRELEPLCRHCKEKGIIKPTQVIDHILPISQGGEPYDIENLQGLCNICHNRKTALENK